jgi:hypothetical protein
MFKVIALAFVALTTAFLCCTPVARAQVSVGVNIGPAPVCPYGYFDYAPYDCAPYGYYGPDWFVGGVFLDEARDGRGNVGEASHDAKTEHALPGYRGGTRGGAQRGGHR